MGAAFSDPALAPALAILTPALAAALILFPGRTGPWLIPRVAPPLTLLATALILIVGIDGAPAAIGGWSVPLGVALRADGLALLFLIMAGVVMQAVFLHALAAPRQGHERWEGRTLWTLLFFLWAGISTVFLSHDLFNLYVALEIASLSGVALIGSSGGATATRAQLRYLLFATFGSLAYLMGVALLYAELGVLDLGLIATAIEPTAPAMAGATLITLGLLLKSAIWPLHFWLPQAHGSAPAPVSAALSGLVCKASLYLLIRLWFDAFSNLMVPAAWATLGALGAIAVLWGSLMALQQERLKLMIAYSTVAQLGYVLFVFPLASRGGFVALDAWNGAILLMLAHGVAKAGMFLSAGAVIAALGSDRRSVLVGATRRIPVPIFALALSGLTVMALPPSGGFVAKWLLLRAALGAEAWLLAGALAIGGLLAAGYVLRFLLPAFSPVPEAAPSETIPTGLMAASAMGLALASIALGLAATPVWPMIETSLPAMLTGEG